MKKILFTQITILILITGTSGGMLLYTDIYQDIRSTIVTTLCLSCIKMDPVAKLEYTFETANNQPHPSFILDNLTKGPIFLTFRKDVCEACDKMDPLLKDIFNVDFGKKELFYETVDYSGSIVNFIHINMDHSSGEILDSFYIYDKDHREGVPMFVMVTLGNNSGIVEPYYTTAYATLGLSSNEGRRAFLRKMISGSLEHYNENIAEYNQELD